MLTIFTCSLEQYKILNKLALYILKSFQKKLINTTTVKTVREKNIYFGYQNIGRGIFFFFSR